MRAGCPRSQKEHIMLEVERPADLVAYAGKEIGVSDWYTVTPGADRQIRRRDRRPSVDPCRCRALQEGDARRQDHRAWLADPVAGAASRLDDLPRQEPLARDQLRRQPGALHRAGAGRARASACASRSRRSSRSRAACASPTRARWNWKARAARCWSPRRSGWSTIEAYGNVVRPSRRAFCAPEERA